MSATEAKVMATHVPIERDAQMDLPFIPGMNRASIEYHQTKEGCSFLTRKHVHGRLIYAIVYCQKRRRGEKAGPRLSPLKPSSLSESQVFIELLAQQASLLSSLISLSFGCLLLPVLA